MAGRWVRSQNSVPIFRRLWTKVHRIKFVCAGVSVVCKFLQRRFPIDDVLLRSGDIHDQVAKLSEIAPKFEVLGPPNFGRNGSLKCLIEFHYSGSPSTCGKVW